MKKYILVLFISIITMSSCVKSDDQKVKSLIEDYFKNNASDFSSYEPIEFGKLEASDKAKRIYKYKVLHKFRINNAFGANVLHEQYFYVTEDMKFAEPE